MKIRAFTVCLILGILSATPVSAHRTGIPVTSIEWNERSNKWEVSHRLSAHDLEKVIGSGVDLNSLSDHELESAVSAYIQSKFFVLGLMFLQFVGAEVEGEYVWAYYELWGWGQTVVVSNKLLTEIDSTSVTLVNVTAGENVRSIVFEQDAAPKRVKLQRP